MKNKVYVFVLLLIMAITVVFLLRTLYLPPERSAPAKMNSNPGVTTVVEDGSSVGVRHNAKSESSDVAEKAIEKLAASKVIERITAVEQSLNIPAAMHGRLIDLNGDPIAGVKVNYSFRGGMLRIVKGSGRGSTVTDENGEFIVRGRGAAMGLGGFQSPDLAQVWMRDPGNRRWYKGLQVEPTSNNRKLGWKDHGKDNPYIVVGHRTERFPGKEMLRGNNSWTLAPNGQMYSVKEGRRPRGTKTVLLASPGADPTALFNVACERGAYDRTKSFVEQNADWRYVFRASQGGGVRFSELDSPAIYEAPLDGYQSKVEVRRVEDPDHYERRLRVFDKVIYFQADEGRTHGAIRATFRPLDRKEDCEVRLKYRIRHDGGRNLAVRSLNRLPISEPPDTIHTQVNTQVEFTITAHDPDEEQELTVDPYGFTRGRVDPRELKVVDGKATFVFKPRKDYEGPASFLYSVTDGNGGRLGPITVHVQVGELAEGEAETAQLE